MSGGGNRTVDPSFVYQYQQESELLAKQRGELIREAINNLEHSERLALCFRLEGVKLMSLGRMLGCSHTWAMNLYNSAVVKIREELKAKGVDSLGDIS